MSTTLTNGLKLPDKGSVDWYADMQSNYTILDGAVGTVAEHTTQIAGKAPAVHTHTKADITDFPAYGNTAGTICEGNDSRLSDARTPVAHTHTKSDVTDLFNSANTWSGDNTFSKTVTVERSTDTGNFLALRNSVAELGSTPVNATPVTIAYRDKNDDNLGYMGVFYDTDGSNLFRLYVRNKYTSGTPSTSGTADYAFFGLRLNADKSKEGILRASFRPYDNNTYDLGSSSYQWNNLYAKKVNIQSVNSINPGALSLSNFDSDGYEDLSSDLTENVQYTYTPVVDGWLALYAQVNGFHAENAVGIFNADMTLGNNSFRWAASATAAINLQRQTGKYFGSIFLPVRAGYPYYCWLRVGQSTTLGQKKLIFYKAKGNV